MKVPWRKMRASTLTMVEAVEILTRFDRVLVGEQFEAAGLKPAALLELWRHGFEPERQNVG